MIKTILYKVFSISLALLVLFSTVSFTIEKHFCGDVLVDIAMFSEAETCGMEAMEMLQKKSCCKDEVDVVKGQDELKLSSFEDLDLEQQQLLSAFIVTYVNRFEPLSQHSVPHKNYSPPNLVADIQLLDQVFII